MAELVLAEALAELRTRLLSADALVRAVASGRRRGARPAPERVELRVLDLPKGKVLQAVSRTGPLVRTTNTGTEDAAALAEVLDPLLDQPFGNWYVVSTTEAVQFRITRKGKVFRHVEAAGSTQGDAHDQTKQHLIRPDDPLFGALGASGDKRRQVDAFLGVVRATLRIARRRGLIADDGVRVVDLGCGNAYLTLAAHRYLTEAIPGTETVGVERRPELVERSSGRAARAGLAGVRFIEGGIGADPGLDRVDLVLALHACDTATDDALAQAVTLGAPMILAAPCCHHDLQRQLALTWHGAPGPDPYRLLTRHPILRERYADVLTDGIRAALLRRCGYSVDVSEFVDSKHTPRNAMIRAVAGGGGPGRPEDEHLADLLAQWRLLPRLATLLADAGQSSSPQGAPRE